MNPTSPPPPKRRGRRLRSVENVRAFVADVLRKVEASIPEGAPLDPARARVMLYGASILASLVQGSDFEERLRELERQAAKVTGSAGSGRGASPAGRFAS